VFAPPPFAPTSALIQEKDRDNQVQVRSRLW
jgi:hypothetical protein